MESEASVDGLHDGSSGLVVGLREVPYAGRRCHYVLIYA